MTPAAIRSTTAKDEPTAVDTVVLAFAGDPIARWCWRNGRQYLANMPEFTRAFGGGAFAHNTAHCTDDCSGVALWLPPGVHPDEAVMGELLQRTAVPELLADLQVMFERMAAFHPNGPHWYLPIIAVDPAHQGKGIGSALLSHALIECDRDHLPAYLESTNPRNVPLYKRHGFEVLGRIQVGSSPTVTPMLRHPR